MLYWTKDEYVKFSEEIMDKPVSFYAFEMLYWCGLRLGEMLAPTPADFNFEKGIVRINKSYQRIGSEDIITDPKTEKSNRNVQIPSFLIDEIKEHLDSLYGIEDSPLQFSVSFISFSPHR
jgi:integrase